MLGQRLPPEPRVTDDPALCVVAAGRTIQPINRDRNRYVFVLPRGVRNARLVSRSAVPSEVRPWIEDRRRLGVMVSRLTLRVRESVETIPLDHPLLRAGWWGLEHEGDKVWRWTDGSAVLPVRGDEPAILEVDLAATLAYPADVCGAQISSQATARKHPALGAPARRSNGRAW